MNRKLKLGLIGILFLSISSCGTKRFFIKNENGKIVDKRLVGIWKGKESNNIIIGMSSEWKMTRNFDGTFILKYKANLNGD